MSFCRISKFVVIIIVIIKLLTTQDNTIALRYIMLAGSGSGACMLVDCGGESIAINVYEPTTTINERDELQLVYQYTASGAGGSGKWKDGIHNREAWVSGMMEFIIMRFG